MTGYWIYDGHGEFNSLEEMWDYIRDNECYFDEVEFERWLNNNYTAAQIVFDLDRRNPNHTAEYISLEYYEAFEDAMWAPDVQDALVEGEDYYYGPNGEYKFEWIEEVEE